MKKSPVPRWQVILCVVTAILWTICAVCYGRTLDLTDGTDQMVLGLFVVTTVIWWVRSAVLCIRFFRSRRRKGGGGFFQRQAVFVQYAA